MKKYLIIFFILNVSLVFAQHPEIKRATHWYFGWNAGLDFSNDTVVADVNGAYDNYEATATISDTAGNLLFYTDAETVWNRNHQVMQNGTYIGGCWSSTQGALIVPQPGNDSIYYIFTTDCAENNLAGGLRYSIVNINLENGLGTVTEKGVLLHASVAEKLAGIYHSNKTDIWVVTHEWNSSNFFAFRFNNMGLDTVPILSNIGSIHSGPLQPFSTAAGYIKFSPNGKKIVSLKSYGGQEIELFDFNDSSGSVSNFVTLGSGGTLYPYGASFSSNSSRLYISYGFGGGDGTALLPGKIYQYDLFAGTSSEIINSKTLIFAPANNFTLALENAIDGKIYVSITDNLTNEGSKLGVINYPNAVGISCNFVANGVNLTGGKRCRYGLPNYIESYFNCDTCAIDSSGVGISEFVYKHGKTLVFPNPFENFIFIKSSEEIISWIIKDINGIVLYNEVLDIPKYNVEISNLYLPNGIYTICVTTKSFNYIQKLIKLINQ